jgi:hypothetical protein
MVVAVAALCFALVGTAAAGVALTKKEKKQVKTIIAAQAPGLSVASAKKADTATIANSLADGAVRGADLGPITTVSSTSASFPQDTVGSAFVQCPAGTVVLSGGAARVAGDPDVLLTLSRKSDPNGWRSDAYNPPGNQDAAITVFAYCLG